MKYIKLFEQFITEAKFPGRKGDFIKWKGEYFDVKKTAGSTAYVKFPHTAASAFSQVWGDEVTLSDETHKGKKVWLMESTVVNEAMSFQDLVNQYKDNPYGIGANSIEYVENENWGNQLILRFEDNYSRKETEAELKKMGIKAKKMSKYTADKAFKYRYELIVFESAVNERYVTKRDIEGWEKDNGKLPFPPEVLAATKLMAKYKLADDDQLTRAHIWYRFHDGSWIDMEKFGAHVKKFYGSDFYTEFSSGYTSMFMEAKAHAASIMALIEDKNANGEAIEPAYYEVKEWFKNHDLDYKRSRIFNAAVDYVQKWLKESGIKTL